MLPDLLSSATSAPPSTSDYVYASITTVVLLWALYRLVRQWRNVGSRAKQEALPRLKINESMVRASPAGALFSVFLVGFFWLQLWLGQAPTDWWRRTVLLLDIALMVVALIGAVSVFVSGRPRFLVPPGLRS